MRDGITGCKAENESTQLKSLTEIAKMVCNPNISLSFIVHTLAKNGMIPFLIKLIENHKSIKENILHKALLCLTNLTVSTNEQHIDDIVESNNTINILWKQ